MSSGLQWPSEGGFLQTALPTFGITPEARSNVETSETSGMGRFAFSSASHLTEQHALNSNTTSRYLISEWGYYWNKSRPVLLQKTPAHMLTTRLLQSLLAPNAIFLIIARHPLAVTLAHRHMPSCKTMSAASLTLHWVAQHRVLAADAPHLDSLRLVRYEDLASQTRSCLLAEVMPWLNLPTSGMDLPRRMDAHVDLKYEMQFCGHLLRTPAQAQRHCALAAALQPAIDELGLGYDVRLGNSIAFECLRQALSNATGIADPCSGVAPTKWVGRELDRQQSQLQQEASLTRIETARLSSKLICTSASNGAAPHSRGRHKIGRKQKKHMRVSRSEGGADADGVKEHMNAAAHDVVEAQEGQGQTRREDKPQRLPGKSKGKPKQGLSKRLLTRGGGSQKAAIRQKADRSSGSTDTQVGEKVNEIAAKKAAKKAAKRAAHKADLREVKPSGKSPLGPGPSKSLAKHHKRSSKKLQKKTKKAASYAKKATTKQDSMGHTDRKMKTKQDSAESGENADDPRLQTAHLLDSTRYKISQEDYE